MKSHFLFGFVCMCVLFSADVWAGGKKDDASYQAKMPDKIDVSEFMLALPVQAEKREPEKITLTVDEAVSYALENSKTLKAASIDMGIKERQKNTAWNVFVPNVSLNGTIARSNEVSGILGSLNLPLLPPSAPKTEVDHWSALGSVSASLNLSVALIDGIKATYANYEAGLITWEQTRMQTERDIRRMFYSILLLQENLKLQQDMLETARQRVVQSQINYRNGLVPELTLLQSQVAYENRKPAILELQQSVQQQLQTFAFLLGFPYGTELALSGQINPQFLDLDANNLTNKYLANRLDIISLQKNIQLMEIQLSSSKLQAYTPSLSLGYSWSPVVKIFNQNWFNMDNITDQGKFNVSLVFNVTGLLPFSSTAQNIKNTEANLAKFRLNLATVIQNGEMEINMLVQKLNKSKTAINASQLNIDLAQKAYNLTVTAFRNGTKELLDVRDAESQLNQAQLGLLQEKYNYVSGLLDLEYALNTQLEK